MKYFKYIFHKPQVKEEEAEYDTRFGYGSFKPRLVSDKLFTIFIIYSIRIIIVWLTVSIINASFCNKFVIDLIAEVVVEIIWVFHASVTSINVRF